MSEGKQNSWRRERVRGLAAVGLLLLVLALFLGPALLPGRVLMPLDILHGRWPPWQQPGPAVPVNNELLGDVVNYIFPVKQFMVESVRGGEFPLWNPHVLGGYPFVYNTQAGLFYPFSLLYYLLPWYTAVDGTISWQLALGLAAMFAYLRLLSVRRLAAVAGSLLFGLNGLMMVWLEWQVVHAAIIWLPLQLYLLERLARTLEHTTQHDEPTHLRQPASIGGKNPRAALRYALLAAIAFALPWLGGHWNWALYVSLTAGVYLLWRLWPLWRGRKLPPGRLLAFYLLPFLTGTALALVQVWPAFSFLRQTHRTALPFWESLRSGLWNRAIVLLLPDFFGNPSHDNNWWGADNYNEAMLFLGILPLFLIVLAGLLRRDTYTRFYTLWGLLGLLWTLGIPAYATLYALPVFNGLYPTRAAVVFVFSGAVLAALALDRLLDNATLPAVRLTRAILLVAAGCLLLLAVYGLMYRTDVNRTAAYLIPRIAWLLLSLLVSVVLLWGRARGWLRPGLFGAVAVGWIALELYRATAGYNTVSPASDYYPAADSVRFLQQDPELFRIATPAAGVVFYPNTAMLLGISNASGYEPGLPRRHVALYNAAEGESAIRFNRVLMPLKGLDSPLMDMLNVKYLPTIEDRWAGSAVPDVQQPQVDTWLPLGEGNPAGQLFTTSDAGLHRIDLPLRVGEDAAGIVILRVYTADGGQELAHAAVDISEADNGNASFYFGAFPSEWGREFRFIVSFDGSGDTAIGAATADVYPAGSRLQGLEPASGDLAFTTYYLPRPALAHESGKTRLYLNEGYFPRAYAVHEGLFASEAEEALSLLMSHTAELRELVVLEAEPPAGTPAAPTADVTSTVTVTHYGLNEVALRAEMAAPGYVVLADSYYPGWQATVDGEAVPVYRANYILRAVPVPAGDHAIVFRFRPFDFFAGAVISGTTLLLVVMALFFLSRPVQRRGR